MRDHFGGRFRGFCRHVADRRARRAMVRIFRAPRLIVQCGYSSLEGCENSIGKGAMCFVNPYVAINDRRTVPAGGVAARKG